MRDNISLLAQLTQDRSTTGPPDLLRFMRGGGGFGAGIDSLLSATAYTDNLRNAGIAASAQASQVGRQAQQAAASAAWGARVPAAIPAEYQPIVAQAAQQFGVDPSLIAAVLKQESGFDPTRTNQTSGAAGIAQFMPATARGYGVADPYNPQQAIPGAAHYLSDLMRQYGGDQQTALIAYNGGQRAVDAWRSGQPFGESQAYVKAVQGFYDQFRGQTVQAGPATVAAGPLAGVSQYDLGLPKEIADAFCGPAAAILFARVGGRNPTVQETLDFAKEVGWTTGDAGMGGVGRAVALMQRLGAPAVAGPVDAPRIQQEIAAGRPVVIDTPGHYYQIIGYNAETGGFIMGDAVGRRRGAAGVRLDQLGDLGFGAARTAIYLGQGQ